MCKIMIKMRIFLHLQKTPNINPMLTHLAVRFETPCLDKNSFAWKVVVWTFAELDDRKSGFAFSGYFGDDVTAEFFAPATRSLKRSVKVCCRPFEFCFTTPERIVIGFC